MSRFSGWRQNAAGGLGNLLIAVGALILLGVAGTQGYSWYSAQQIQEQKRLEFEQAVAVYQATATAQANQTAPVSAPAYVAPAASPSSEAEATPGPTQLAVTATATAEPTPAPTVTPTPEPLKEALPPLRIRLGSVGIDSAVVEAGIVGGQYEVPNFVVGHYKGTALPAETGNSVLSGHLQSLQGGNVFAELLNAKMGDEIELFTVAYRAVYVVDEIVVVPSTALKYMDQTDDARVTLITCTGDWDWRTRDYSKRYIVIGKLKEPAPIASANTAPKS
ncbi:MAG: sortase [Chloroflexi bacterium]|nr:sortase [Chloroflexota bacterium]